jgi:hypothetical protein
MSYCPWESLGNRGGRSKWSASTRVFRHRVGNRSRGDFRCAASEIKPHSQLPRTIASVTLRERCNELPEGARTAEV